MKKILILGASGLLGHVIFNYFSGRNYFETYGTIRPKSKKYLNKYFRNYKNIFLKDPLNSDQDKIIFKEINFDIVINCISLSRQNHSSYMEKDFEYIYYNIPYQLYELSKKHNFKFINLSSDGVYRGTKGNYGEKDATDSKDYYGIYKSKAENISDEILTIRTSIIGHEIKEKLSLLEWVINSTSEIFGYQRVMYSGLTSLELAKILDNTILSSKNFVGLFNVSGPIISKYDLLRLINSVYELNLVINVDNSNVLDRSLNDDKFRNFINLDKKSWLMMLSELKINPHGVKNI